MLRIQNNNKLESVDSVDSAWYRIIGLRAPARPVIDWIPGGFFKILTYLFAAREERGKMPCFLQMMKVQIFLIH